MRQRAAAGELQTVARAGSHQRVEQLDLRVHFAVQFPAQLAGVRQSQRATVDAADARRAPGHKREFGVGKVRIAGFGEFGEQGARRRPDHPQRGKIRGHHPNRNLQPAAVLLKPPLVNPLRQSRADRIKPAAGQPRQHQIADDAAAPVQHQTERQPARGRQAADDHAVQKRRGLRPRDFPFGIRRHLKQRHRGVRGARLDADLRPPIRRRKRRLVARCGRSIGAVAIAATVTTVTVTTVSRKPQRPLPAVRLAEHRAALAQAGINRRGFQAAAAVLFQLRVGDFVPFGEGGDDARAGERRRAPVAEARHIHERQIHRGLAFQQPFRQRPADAAALRDAAHKSAGDEEIRRARQRAQQAAAVRRE